MNETYLPPLVAENCFFSLFFSFFFEVVLVHRAETVIGIGENGTD